MNKELKKCPFCDGEAYTYTATNVENGVKRKYWLVHCKDCELNYPSFKHKCFTEEQAINFWNKRQ